jgi:hypothetical protein
MIVLLGAVMKMHVRVSLLIVAVAVMAALVVGVDGLDPTPAKARKGYGGYKGYKPCRTACQVKKCRKGCKKARRTCVYCAKQDLKPLRAACTGPEKKTCRKGVKAQTSAAVQQCKSAIGECGGCCKNDYSGSCTGAFAGTSGFGSYFRTSRNYGKVRRYKPECDGNTGGGGGSDCLRACEKARAAALRTCKRGCDTVAIEAAYQACRVACVGSPGGAFLD